MNFMNDYLGGAKTKNEKKQHKFYGMQSRREYPFTK